MSERDEGEESITITFDEITGLAAPGISYYSITIEKSMVIHGFIWNHATKRGSYPAAFRLLDGEIQKIIVEKIGGIDG